MSTQFFFGNNTCRMITSVIEKFCVSIWFRILSFLSLSVEEFIFMKSVCKCFKRCLDDEQLFELIAKANYIVISLHSPKPSYNYYNTYKELVLDHNRKNYPFYSNIYNRDISMTCKDTNIIFHIDSFWYNRHQNTYALVTDCLLARPVTKNELLMEERFSLDVKILFEDRDFVPSDPIVLESTGTESSCVYKKNDPILNISTKVSSRKSQNYQYIYQTNCVTFTSDSFIVTSLDQKRPYKRLKTGNNKNKMSNKNHTILSPIIVLVFNSHSFGSRALRIRMPARPEMFKGSIGNLPRLLIPHPQDCIQHPKEDGEEINWMIPRNSQPRYRNKVPLTVIYRDIQSAKRWLCNNDLIRDIREACYDVTTHPIRNSKPMSNDFKEFWDPF